MLPEATPSRRMPSNIAEGRLLGGLDLAATLRAGRPIAERGLLAEADGGIVVVAMAERLAPMATAHLAASMDKGEVTLERDGLGLRLPTRFGVVALDEGLDDERIPAVLADRLAFHLDLDAADADAAGPAPAARAEIGAARAGLDAVNVPDQILEALCGTALALGIGSIRPVLQALKAAKVMAALAGRTTVAAEDAAVAARLVFAPRATQLPAPPPDEAADPQEAAPPQSGQAEAETDQPLPEDDRLPEELILAAAQAAIPPGLLAQLALARTDRKRPGSSGKAGAPQMSLRRGRPIGVRRGEPRSGARLNLIETLRAAAPWQRLRRAGTETNRIAIRPDDFRVTRLKQRAETTTIFVVDASGSSAVNRLAEAKGAVELLLAECYVRRDQVALIAFRARSADLLLPPTRSLVRAKRSLAGLPGGGGTPLASGIDAAIELADTVRRQGRTPVVIVMTDGKANIDRTGRPGRPDAEADAKAAAGALRAAGFTAMLVDTSPKPQKSAALLAEAMGAYYLPLPQADAGVLSRTVRAATARAEAGVGR
jgi:magnesium chelatase subunit D